MRIIIIIIIIGIVPCAFPYYSLIELVKNPQGNEKNLHLKRHMGDKFGKTKGYNKHGV